MNRSLNLCLALLCIGVWTGCSTIPKSAALESAEGRWFDNPSVICLPRQDRAHPWQLVSARTFPTFNEQELFLTVHERKLDDYHSDSTCAIYLKQNSRFKLLKRLSTDGLSYFDEPKFIRFGPDRTQLIDITECFYGSGGLTAEHIFNPVVLGSLPHEDIGIDEVAFTPASDAYPFGPGEYLHWEADTLSDDNFSFTMLVDHETGPDRQTVGKVTGHFKLKQTTDGHWHISPANYTRVPAVYEDYH